MRSSWWRLFSRRSTNFKQPSSRANSSTSRFRPQVESLEERQLLAAQILLEQTGFAPLQVIDNGPGDTDPLVGSVVFTGSYGTFEMAVVALVSKPQLGSLTAAQMEFHYSLLSMAGGTLRITGGDTDFVVPGAPFQLLRLTSTLGGGIRDPGSATMEAFADPNNAPLGMTVSAGLHGPFTGFFTDTRTTTFTRGAGSYSMGSVTVVALGQGSGASWDHVLDVTAAAAPPLAAVGDFVFEDLDADGIQDVGERGVPNVTVRLFDTNDVLIGTTTTDSNGFYRFSNLTPGSYYLVFTPPAGFVVSPSDQGTNDALDSDIGPLSGRTANFTLAAGQTDLTRDAGLYRASSISGFVYVDVDNDGVFDVGESPIAGVTVTLTGTDNLGNPVSRTTTTDGRGLYRFDNLRAGRYRLNETQPANYLDGKDSVGSQGGTLTANDQIGNINLAPNVHGVNNNFGEVLPSALSGCVYLDRSRAGVRRPGDPGVPGVTVILTGVDNQGRTVRMTRVTDPLGCYSFGTLVPGTYHVRTIPPVGFQRGASNPGTTGGIPGPSTLSNIPAPFGGESRNNDFGLVRPQRLSKAMLIASVARGRQR